MFALCINMEIEIICRKYNYLRFMNVSCSSYCACNMTLHEIAYLHFICTITSRRVGCGCMVLLFTILGECVVSSEIRQRPKSRLTVV